MERPRLLLVPPTNVYALSGEEPLSGSPLPRPPRTPYPTGTGWAGGEGLGVRGSPGLTSGHTLPIDGLFHRFQLIVAFRIPETHHLPAGRCEGLSALAVGPRSRQVIQSIQLDNEAAFHAGEIH